MRRSGHPEIIKPRISSSRCVSPRLSQQSETVKMVANAPDASSGTGMTVTLTYLSMTCAYGTRNEL